MTFPLPPNIQRNFVFNSYQRPHRLFDIETRSFTVSTSTSKYAILSHRWGPDDSKLTFQKVLNGVTALDLHAFPKFDGFCKVAIAEYGCRYVWVDSLCINQADTEELGASIQSMYWWYANAEVCIVYLADVNHPISASAAEQHSYIKSEWFVRGWTLQELLASIRTVFFYGDWSRVSGFKYDIWRDKHLGSGSGGVGEKLYDYSAEGFNRVNSIAKAAHVDSTLFLANLEPSPQYLELFIRWASHRRTTLPEDAAYSLVSLLDVCLPPKYGEGRNEAMQRLMQACLSAQIQRSANGSQYSVPMGISFYGRESTSLCSAHKSANPFFVRVSNNTRHKKFLLYTNTPIPIEQRWTMVVASKTAEIQPDQLILYRHPYSVIPSTFVECSKCSSQY